MRGITIQRGLLTVLAMGAIWASGGCSRHEDAPLTPASSSKTPTFRSFANSTDQPNTPLYNQPGLNGGKPVNLPKMASQKRFDQNAPLAQVVDSVIKTRTDIDPRYVATEAEGGVVRITGTIPSRVQHDIVLSVARKQNGVTRVIDDLKVQK